MRLGEAGAPPLCLWTRQCPFRVNKVAHLAAHALDKLGGKGLAHAEEHAPVRRDGQRVFGGACVVRHGRARNELGRVP